MPFGLPLSTLLHDWAGGPPDGRSIRAVTMAGLSGGFLAGDDNLGQTQGEPARLLREPREPLQRRGQVPHVGGEQREPVGPLEEAAVVGARGVWL